MAGEARERILAAAGELLRENVTISVRGVAARAGIGASTLRHYFPTQKALMGALLTAVYDEALPDDRMRDTSLEPRERLLESLWQLLEPVGSPIEARSVWSALYESFIGPAATEDARTGYIVLVREAHQRVVAWLALLEDEGVLPLGDNDARARLLLTLVDGLSIERALMNDPAHLATQRSTLAMAVDACFARPA